MKTLGEDKLVEEILNIIESAQEPLETEEIISRIRIKQQVSRPKVMYRLNNLRAEGRIAGKMLGAGKGVWVWWMKRVLVQVKGK